MLGGTVAKVVGLEPTTCGFGDRRSAYIELHQCMCRGYLLYSSGSRRDLEDLLYVGGPITSTRL